MSNINTPEEEEALSDIAFAEMQTAEDVPIERDIRSGQRDRAEKQLEDVAEILSPEWIRGRVLPQYVGAASDARIHAIRRVLGIL